MEEILFDGSGAVTLEVDEFDYVDPNGDVMRTQVYRKPGSAMVSLLH